MGFWDYFDYRSEIFGYSWVKGDNCDYGWPINYNRDNGEDILSLNSKIYNEFINVYFYNKLELLFNNKTLARVFKPRIELREDENGVKTLHFSHVHYLKQLIDMTDNEYSNISNVTDYSIDNLIELTKKAYNEDKRIYKDVLNNNNKSIYYNDIFNKYKMMIGKNNIDLNMYLNTNIESCNLFIYVLNNIKPIFEKELNFVELAKCFDYDQLMMLICKSFIDYCEDFSEKVGEPDYCICYVKRYIDTLKKYLELDPNYYCSIMTEKGKFSTVKLIRQCDKYFDKLDENLFSYCCLNENFLAKNNLTVEELNKLNPKEFTRLVFMLQEKELSEDINQEGIQSDIKEISERIDKTDDNNERLKLIQQKEKIEFLLNNKPVKILHGINNFSNYYGYVYENGYVVFDVLDKNVNKSYGNAMYIMSYDKINEYCSKTKTELRSNDFSDINVILHVGNWKERLINKLNELEKLNIDINSINSIEIDKIATIEELRMLETRLTNLSECDEKLIKEKERKIKAYKKIDIELQEDKEIEIDKEELDHLTSNLIEEIKGKNLTFEEVYVLANIEEQDKTKTKYNRKKSVRAFTKERARDEEGNYTCELCGDKSFFDSSFDCHHVIPLENNGADNIYNTVCICLGCHGQYHRIGFTYNQQYQLFTKIKKHLIDENIEYLPVFEEMISPNAKDDDYYLNHKDEVDRNFSISWNYTRKLNK